MLYSCGLVAPGAVRVEQREAKWPFMARPAVAGSCVHVGVGVELGEELLEVDHAQREHPGLVAVVAGAPVAFAEGARDGELGDLLAVAEDAELGLAAQHFAAADDGCLARAVGQAVIGDELVFRERKVFGLSICPLIQSWFLSL